MENKLTNIKERILYVAEKKEVAKENLCKKIGTDDSNLLLVSDNKDYDPFLIGKDEITGMALIVVVIRLE